MSKKFKIIYYFLVTVMVMVFSYHIYLLVDFIREEQQTESAHYIADED